MPSDFTFNRSSLHPIKLCFCHTRHHQVISNHHTCAWQASEKELETLFGALGRVDSVSIVRDPLSQISRSEVMMIMMRSSSSLSSSWSWSSSSSSSSSSSQPLLLRGPMYAAPSQSVLTISGCFRARPLLLRGPLYAAPSQSILTISGCFRARPLLLYGSSAIAARPNVCSTKSKCVHH
jgi:hypothetical protein